MMAFHSWQQNQSVLLISARWGSRSWSCMWVLPSRGWTGHWLFTWHVQERKAGRVPRRLEEERSECHGTRATLWGMTPRISRGRQRCLQGKDGHQFTQANKTECAGFKASLGWKRSRGTWEFKYQSLWTWQHVDLHTAFAAWGIWK